MWRCKVPPLQLSSAVGVHAVRCTGAVPCVWLGSDRGVVMLLGNHKSGMHCPEPRLCYLGKDEASTASAWLGAVCQAALQQPWRLSGPSSPKQKVHFWGLGASTQHGCDLPTSVCRKGVTGICHLDVSLWLVT